MSLKAKIEAVIYASEEPVTLGQLVGLLGLEGQAELDRRENGQGTLGLEALNPGTEPEAEVPKSLAGPAPALKQMEAEEPSAESRDPATDLDQASSSLPAEEAPSDGPEREQPELLAAERRSVRERERRLREFFRELVDDLVRDYATSERGLEVREVAGGFRMGTKPEYHDAVRGFVRSLKPPLKLSLQALETLAVVAYKQPVTAPEVSEIRGVDSGGVLGSLIGRKLIATAGRKQVIGRPILYKTSKDFLLRFGLKDLSELPSIEEFEKMAGEMAAQEEIAMPTIRTPTSPQEGSPLGDTGDIAAGAAGSQPQADGDSNDLPSSASGATPRAHMMADKTEPHPPGGSKLGKEEHK